GERADAVLALVEGVLPRGGRRGIAIGNDPLGERSAVEDRPDAAAILITDSVEDEALARSEPDAKPPFLPGELVARELEARALGLGDLQPPEIGPRTGRGMGDVPRGGGGGLRVGGILAW